MVSQASAGTVSTTAGSDPPYVVVYDDVGNATAVWSRTNASNNLVVWANRYAPATG